MNELEQSIKDGYITVQKHPTENLYIYNYTNKCQYGRHWNETTMMCRGLILDENKNIIARPFKKFFNLEEYKGFYGNLPNENYKITEKLDGSLGILYFGKEYAISTRGSFVSDQAEKATKILHEKYSHILSQIKPDVTYLFEIIYPENKIIVNYGDKEDIILLAIIDNKTGKDLPLENIGFDMVKEINSSIKNLESLGSENKEGYVVQYESGLRVKVKLKEYLELYQWKYNFTKKIIWEYLKDDRKDEIISSVPDEFYDETMKMITSIEGEYRAIETYCKSVFKTFETRKETAEYFNNCKYPGILFAMLDNRSYKEIIYKSIKP